MKEPLTETVTIQRPVPQHIRDLVLFAKSLQGRDLKAMTDEELITSARAFWDNQHGED